MKKIKSSKPEYKLQIYPVDGNGWKDVVLYIGDEDQEISYFNGKDENITKKIGCGDLLRIIKREDK